MVSTSRGSSRSIERDDYAVSNHAKGTIDNGGGIVEYGAWFAARGQRTVRLIGAIGKGFGRDAEAGAAPRREDFGAR